MSKLAIGMDRTLRSNWLDLVAALAANGASKAEARERLRAGLRPEIVGQEALEKTVTALLRLWYPDDEVRGRLLDEAKAFIRHGGEDDRRAVYWGLLLTTYPFFRDAAVVIGRLSRLQPTFTAVQMRRRLLEEHGDRAAIERARQFVVQNLVLWGIVRMISRRGVYQVAEPIPLVNLQVQRWLLEAALQARPGDALPLEGVTLVPELFPFSLTDQVVQLVRDPRFQVSTQRDQRLMLSLAQRP